MILGRLLRAWLRAAVRETACGVIPALGLARRLVTGRPPEADRAQLERILVIRLDLLGDVLNTLPLVDSLKAAHPNARIVMLTLPYTAPLARLSPNVDEVIAIDTNRIRTVRGLISPGTWLGYVRALSNLRSERFEVAVSVYGQMGSLWAFLSGAERSFGYEREAYRHLLTNPLPGGRHADRKSEGEYTVAFAPVLGAQAKLRSPELVIPATSRDGARELLARNGIAPGSRLVAIHAGASNGGAKRWPAQSWSRFAEVVQGQTGASVLLLGSAADAGIAHQVIAGSAARLVSLAGLTDIPLLAAVLERADVVASGDSGPLHLAAALGKPLVAVYGPTDPTIYGPLRSGGRIQLHRQDLPCSPCYTLAAVADCPLGDPICMRLVTVDRMARSAIELLEHPDCRTA